MPVAARYLLLFVVLAVLSGLGIVYAPVLAYTTVAVAFAVGLWSVIRTRERSPSIEIGSHDKNAGEQAEPRNSLTTRLVTGFLLVWWSTLIAPIVLYSPREDVLRAAEVSVGGSMRTQALVLSFAFVGALFLPEAIKRFDPAFRWVVILWSLHLAWILVSVAWSEYPPLTFRNGIAFVLLSVGSFGLGAGFYGSRPDGRKTFLRHVFAAGVLSALAILLPLPLRWDQYDLLDPSSRLSIGGGFPAYVVRPVLCVLLLMVAATILRMRDWRRRDWGWIVLLLIPLLVLKSRGPVLWAVLALGIFYLLYSVRIQDRLLQAALLIVVGLGAYLCYSAGVYDLLVPYLARGDVEDTMALTGRVPLWDILISEIEQHPWIGVGFAAFWNPGNIAWVQQVAGWHAVSAHNGYLDMLLGTGAIGLCVFLTFCFYTMALVRRRARHGDPLGWLALLLLTFYLLLNLTAGIFSEFLEFTLIVILSMLGLMCSRSRAGRSASRRAPDAARERVALLR